MLPLQHSWLLLIDLFLVFLILTILVCMSVTLCGTACDLQEKDGYDKKLETADEKMCRLQADLQVGGK